MRPFEGEHDGSSVTICACAGFKPVLGSGRASFENRPEFVSREDVPAERLDSEREILKVQVMNEGKPAAVADKIVNGRLGKFFEEVCLVDQPYIRDMKVSVSAHAAELGKRLGGEIKVVAYTRYECGEGIEKREDNFAEEVEKMMK